MPKGLKGFQKGHPMFRKTGGFQKGHIPWHKGKTLPYIPHPNQRGIVPWCKGKRLSLEHKLKLSLAHKGKKLSESTKIKIGLASKGNKYALGNKLSIEVRNKMKGRIPPNKGKHYSQEIIDKMRENYKYHVSSSCFKDGQTSGDKNNKWKGGITPVYRQRFNSTYWTKHRKLALKRDLFTCQVCGIKDCRLEIHHKIPWRISRNDSLDNLITVCVKCHKKLEKSF